VAFNPARLSEGLGARFAHGDQARSFRQFAFTDRIGHSRASPDRPALGGRGEGPTARDRRGVLLPAAQGGGRKAHSAPARQKPSRSGKDQRGCPLGNPVSGGAERQGFSARANRRPQRGRHLSANLHLRPSPSARRGAEGGDRAGLPRTKRADHGADPSRPREWRRGRQGALPTVARGPCVGEKGPAYLHQSLRAPDRRPSPPMPLLCRVRVHPRQAA